MADEVNKPDIDNETSNFRNTTLAALARLKEQNQALTNEANKNKAATLAYNRAQKKKKRREALSAKITNVKGLEGLQESIDNNKDLSDDMVEAELESLLRETDEVKVGDAITNIAKFDNAIKQTREQIPGPLRELLGEVKDPIKQYMRTAAKINTYIADTNFFNTLLKKGKD